MHSRQQSPMDSGPQHHTFSRGNCSAYGSAAKTDENWTTISDKAERRRVQNRIAQRAYRQKLKERLQHLEKRAAELQSSSTSTTTSSSKLHCHNYEEECYSNISSNASTSSDEHCRHCSHTASRAGTASPPTQYANHFGLYGQSSHLSHLNRSPHASSMGPEMLPYFQDMHQITEYPMSTSSEMSLSVPFLADGSQDMGLNVQYLHPFDMPLMKFEPDELSSSFLNC